MQWLVISPFCFLLVQLLYKQLRLYFSRRTFKQSSGCLPPPAFPQFDRILGLGPLRENLRCVRNGQLLNCLTRRFEATGNTYTICVAGNAFIMTIDPENLRAVNSTQFDDFAVAPARGQALSPLLNRSIFTANGTTWQHDRAMLRPSFARHQFANYQAFEPHLDRLVAQIPRDGSTVDLEPLVYRFTLDAATDILVGQPVASLAPGISEQAGDFVSTFQTATRGVHARLRMGKFLAFLRDPGFDEACKALHRYADEMVGNALEYRRSVQVGMQASDEKSSQRVIFLHELAKDTSDPGELRGHLLTLLLAGIETTSSLLCSTFYLLGHHQRVWEKLQSEVLPLDGKTPEWEDLRNMKYLRFVLNEGQSAKYVIRQENKTHHLQ